MRTLFLFCIFAMLIPVAIAQNYTKDGDRLVESAIVERRFTRSDIEKNLAEAKRNATFWQGEVQKWQSANDRAEQLGVEIPPTPEPDAPAHTEPITP